MIRVSAMPLVFQWITGLNFFRYGLVAILVNSYGFGRCQQSAEQNETDITELIPEEKILEIYSSEVIDSDLLMTTVSQLIAGVKKSRGIVMEHFDLIDFDYFWAVIMLFTHMIAFRFITYKIIQMKINSKS